MKIFRAVIGMLLVAGAVGSVMPACTTAYADKNAASAKVKMVDPRIAIATAPVKVRAPYDVTIVREDGTTLSTYSKANRFYVLGSHGDRYTIHVNNPTNRRVEAVVTVDGLDVVDGENGDLKKRGYIIQPHGVLRIEGFRTSMSEVASFRFSSVDDSYAGKKGKARNVGVVAVAIFEEEAPVELVAPQPIEPIDDGDSDGVYDWRTDVVPQSRGGGEGAKTPSVSSRPNRSSDKSTKESVASTQRHPSKPAADSVGGAPAPMPVRPPVDQKRMEADEDYVDEPAPTPRTNRPGLGTEFGESRYSPTQFTKFVRSSSRPIAIAELRYNNMAGLQALGIEVAPLPSTAEIDTRETADPFPGDARFARPVR